GFVRGHPQHFGATLRYDGYCQSLAEAGLTLEPELVAQGYFDLQSGLEATRALLSLPERPTAIFASNDEMAVGALMAAREFGLDVPRDLSIIGFDDTPMSRLISPALTTVRQPLEAMGAAGVEAIVSPDLAPIDYLDFEVILRDSCAAPKGRCAARSALHRGFDLGGAARDVGGEALGPGGGDKVEVLNADAVIGRLHIEARLDGNHRARRDRPGIIARIMHLQPDIMTQPMIEIVDSPGLAENILGRLGQFMQGHACPQP
ncbi:hypothetical protein E4T56_gene4915, partial [Termitomyces sp. T112]